MVGYKKAKRYKTYQEVISLTKQEIDTKHSRMEEYQIVRLKREVKKQTKKIKEIV